MILHIVPVLFYCAFLNAQYSFTDPIIPGYAPDPFVTKTQDYYYLTYTTGYSVSIFRGMSSLKNSNDTKLLLSFSKSAVYIWSDNRFTNIWAPELHFIDGYWYAYFSSTFTTEPYTVNRMYALKSQNIEGPYSLVARMVPPNYEAGYLDATILRYNNSLYWVVSTWARDGQNLDIIKLDGPVAFQGPLVKLHSARLGTSELVGTAIVNEGPAILYSSDGNVHLTYSANGVWTDDYSIFCISLMKGLDPMNPANWFQTNLPILQKNPPKYYGPGHNSFVQSPDSKRWFIFYHSYNYSSLNHDESQRSAHAANIAFRYDVLFGAVVPFIPGMTENAGSNGVLIQSISTNSVIDVTGISINAGALIHEWTFWNGLNQKWLISPVSARIVRFISINSGQCLDVSGFSKAIGQQLQQWPCNSGQNQNWRLMKQTENIYSIQSLSSRLCIDILGGLSLNGTAIVQWTCNGSKSQQWKLVPTL